MTILHIDSAVTGENSVSRQLSAAVISRLTTQTPDADVVYRDLVASPLAHFTPGAAADGILDEYLAAGTVVIGAPLYNFNLPTQLKAWIDRILVAGRTFAYGAEGPVGLAPGIRVIIAVARGGFYGEGSPARAAEHAETYLASVFNFLGIAPEFVVAEGILVSPEQREAALAQAETKIATL